GVIGLASAHDLIVGGGGIAAAESGDHLIDAGELLKHRFSAPEAAAGENGRLLTLHGGAVGVDGGVGKWGRSFCRTGSGKERQSENCQDCVRHLTRSYHRD